MNIITKPDMSLGLSETQAQAKTVKEGFNGLPSSKPRNLFAIALGVVLEPMFLFLVACGTICIAMGEKGTDVVREATSVVMMDDNSHPSSVLVGGRKILFSCLQGVGGLSMVMAIYRLCLNQGYSEEEVRTFCFISLISSNIAVILSNRSWTRNISRS